MGEKIRIKRKAQPQPAPHLPSHPSLLNQNEWSQRISYGVKKQAIIAELQGDVQNPESAQKISFSVHVCVHTQAAPGETIPFANSTLCDEPSASGEATALPQLGTCKRGNSKQKGDTAARKHILCSQHLKRCIYVRFRCQRAALC